MMSMNLVYKCTILFGRRNVKSLQLLVIWELLFRRELLNYHSSYQGISNQNYMNMQGYDGERAATAIRIAPVTIQRYWLHLHTYIQGTIFFCFWLIYSARQKQNSHLELNHDVLQKYYNYRSTQNWIALSIIIMFMSFNQGLHHTHN